MNQFHYALSLLNTLYDIDIPEDVFEEISIIAWQYIGNKRTRIYRYTTCMDNCQKSIELPCNVNLIESVTTSVEDWNYSTNDTPNGDINSAYTESYIESRKAFNNPLYESGKFIKYERVGNTLYFDRSYRQVTVLYRGEILDDDGLPEITDKEAIAIATYCAYVIKYKEGLKTNNPNIIQLAETLRQKWLLQVDQARTDYYMSQNEWDQILDAKTDWNRKQFNKSYKIYR